MSRRNLHLETVRNFYIPQEPLKYVRDDHPHISIRKEGRSRYSVISKDIDWRIR